MKQLILAAKSYKMNVSSPRTYAGIDGLTDQHLIPIGKDTYMVFGHTYTLTEATNNTVTLFNPHGDRKKVPAKLFDKDLKELFGELKANKDDVNMLLDILSSIQEKCSELKAEKIEGKLKIKRVNKWIEKGKTGKIDAHVDELLADEAAKGLLEVEKDLMSEIEITYEALKEYFKSLVFTEITN